ncbi:RagB/SusD family nutrient uptake outer membrane protein [Pedobacter metabolipauper]|uniref:Putative outer membrane starch-binding protein n=1 Tax=Pedobacter metabolipauper TaxID=425513 RepID=A0A4R6SQJ7_9SPHI|nr:RagB/SusD family nutrient uptake outer membrane protein [Pedobacter metabolipauper]TDQ06316.1 putative outer membrane starch-binding protein [Pedobacter metabolipauper]
MKAPKLINISLCLVILFSLSCKKWIEVEPKTQIENDRFFANEQGFAEALNGVYIKMGSTPLYGRELTFGLTDVLGGLYNLSTSNGSVAYRDAFAGAYQNDSDRPIIEGIWSNSYNAISNLNNILEQLETADRSLFSGNQYNIIKGEALGLRAFLHFDLLRLYTPSIRNGGLDKPGVPYVTQYKPVITPKLLVSNTLEKIQADLDAAEDLLKSDPLFTTGAGNLVRNLRFNYYAVKAVKARVFLWKDDKVNALAAAKEVIAAAPVKFPFVLQAAIAAGNEAVRDRVFTTEQIFGLYVNKLAQNYVGILDSTRFTTTLIITAARLAEQFETASIGTTDYRNVYLIRNLTGLATPKIFFGKLYQPSGITEAFSKRMPLIKIPEMYYIAAECLKDTDPATAIGYLTTVRQARGITAVISAASTSAQIQEEIRKEYWKETPSEGQFFFYHKRMNSTTVPGVSGTYPPARYVLPLPQLETEFGY